jgi:hypothetical protein
MLNLWKNRIRPADSINCIYISDGKEQLLVDSAIYNEKYNLERMTVMKKIVPNISKITSKKCKINFLKKDT